MKKTALLLAIILMLMLAVSVSAALPEDISPLADNFYPSISFSGNQAHCKIVVTADNNNDSISATMKLWRGKACLATWDASDNGYLSLSRSKTVAPGYTYKVTADVTINGITYPTVSKSAYFPAQ